MRGRPGGGRRRIAPLLAALLAACSATPSPPPQAPTSSPAPATGSPAARPPDPSTTVVLPPEASSSDPGAISSPPPAGATTLPPPTMSDPFEIGLALYDPGRMADAVVSLLALLRIGIYGPDGTPVRAGAERRVGDPWLTESEVAGLVQMSNDDLAEGGDEGTGTWTLADLHALVAPMAPSLSLPELVAAYRDSYQVHPDDLAPRLLLNQPIDETTRLTTAQLWLLFMDGFVEPAEDMARYLLPGALVAAGSPARLGTARASLPALQEQAGLTKDRFAELLPHVFTIAHAIPFLVSYPPVHEGHGGPGAAATVTAHVLEGQPFVSPIDGVVLLHPNTGSRGGIRVTWRSDNERPLRAHGSLADALPLSRTTDASGRVQLVYRPKAEAGAGQGFVAQELGNLYAEAELDDLMWAAYDTSDPVVAFLLQDASSIWRQPRRAGDGLLIEWHEKGIEIELNNEYDVSIGAGPLGMSMVASASRKGTDSATGVLTRRADGTWRGTLEAFSLTERSRYVYAAGLAGGECEDRAAVESYQYLDVVGTERRRSGSIDPGVDLLVEGAFGGRDLQLSFYPASEPGGPLGCQMAFEYRGPGPDGRRISGAYLPFNHSAWNDPGMGYTIHLPDEGRLVYEDWRQAATTGSPISSTWTVRVELP